MKRILFAGTGKELPSGAFHFLQTLQPKSVCVTGLFFCPLDFEAENSASYVPIAAPYVRVQEKEKQDLHTIKTSFSRQCELHHIPFHLHGNEGQWDKDLFARESRFSDLVVLSAELFAVETFGLQPNSFLYQALQSAECPVVVLPESYLPVKQLVIAYDGSKDCLFALKQFCYLLPQLTDLPAEIIYAKDEITEDIPDLEELRSFCRLHFSSMNFSKLHFRAASHFGDWVRGKESAMLVSGSFGRSGFSYLTKKSFADKTIQDHNMPLFIAHT